MNMFSTIRSWLKRETTLPPSSKGNELFAFLNLPTPVVGWAMSRLRKEYSVDLESLWHECPRADWLLRLGIASGVEHQSIRDVAAKVLNVDKERCASDSIESVLQRITKMIEAVVADDTDLNELRDSDLPWRTGGGQYGPSDEEFERANKIDLAINDLHRPFSDTVRRDISYDEIHHAIYQETPQPGRSPYR